VYFAADDKAPFFLSFSSLFFLSRLCLSLPIFPVTHGDVDADDIPMGIRRLRFFSIPTAHPFSSIPLPTPRTVIAVSFYFEPAQRSRNTTGLPACFINFPSRLLLQPDMKLKPGGGWPRPRSRQRDRRQKNFKFPSNKVALPRNFNIFARNGPLLHALRSITSTRFTARRSVVI